MLQPFERFKADYIDRLIDLNKPFIVTQTYTRINAGLGAEKTTAILLTDYDDMGLAKIHYKAVINDRFAAIIQLTKPAHRQKLGNMVLPGSPYELYWAVVKSKKQLEHVVNTKYRDKMRKYIASQTTWRIDGDSTIRPTVQLIFGELFIVIRHGKQVVRVKFEELEK
jgi:hypothetical protein